LNARAELNRNYKEVTTLSKKMFNAIWVGSV